MGHTTYTTDKVDSLLEEKLKLSGGTITGPLTISTGDAPFIAPASDNVSTLICGGNSVGGGGSITLCGKSYSSSPGGFTLKAGSTVLECGSDKILKWNNSAVITAEGGVMSGPFVKKPIYVQQGDGNIIINPADGNVFIITPGASVDLMQILLGELKNGQTIEIFFHGHPLSSKLSWTIKFPASIQWIDSGEPAGPLRNYSLLVTIMSINNSLYGFSVRCTMPVVSSDDDITFEDFDPLIE